MAKLFLGSQVIHERLATRRNSFAAKASPQLFIGPKTIIASIRTNDLFRNLPIERKNFSSHNALLKRIFERLMLKQVKCNYLLNLEFDLCYGFFQSTLMKFS